MTCVKHKDADQIYKNTKRISQRLGRTADFGYIAMISDFGRDPAYTIYSGVANDYF